MYISRSENLQTTAFLNKNLGWGEHTITDWNNFLRDLCVEIYLVNPQPIGGHGHVVEIDEGNLDIVSTREGECYLDNGYSEGSTKT